MYRPKAFPRTSTSLLLALGDQPDSSVWREFFEHYAPPVYRIAKLRGLQPTDAEDIVQEVMVAIARQITSFDYRRDRGRFRDWVRRIADNKIVDLIRRQRTRNAVGLEAENEPEDVEASVDKYWELQWLMQDLEYCLDRIAARVTAKRIAAFRLYVIEGVSAADTAAQLNMQIGYVYANRNQLLNLIRSEMKALNDAEGEPQ